MYSVRAQDVLLPKTKSDSTLVISVPDSVQKYLPPEAIEAMEDYAKEQDSLRKDSIERSYIAEAESNIVPADTVVKENKPKEKFLDDPIFLEFTDSLVYIPASKDVYIHKDGKVEYQSTQLQSNYMLLNTETKLIKAEGIIDTTTMKTTGVHFVQDAATYDMDSLVYNMHSGKALIHGVKTTEGEGIMYGGTVKKMKDNVTHMHAGRYTTCDADCPHFYLQMTKATVVPGKRTVFGPAYMVFEDVPLYPLTIPFGFFPQKKEQNSGIIIPQIGEENVKGFYLRDLGYYFAINDYVDLKLTGSIYSLGSWGLQAASNYALRYKFSGSLSLQLAQDIIGDPDSPDYINSQGFKLQWTHRQDPKFSPSSTFSASVNLTSNSTFNKYNADNLDEVMNTQTSSTIAYSKNWAGTPFSLSMNASYNQNNRDSTITLGLPTMSFNVSRVSPFKRKNPVGGERWYEKISFTYKMDFQNRVDNLDQDQLFKDAMWDQLKMGVKHTIPVSASFNIGGVFNITPSFNYNEKWYFKSVDQTWDEDQEKIVYDTTNGFYRLYDYNLALSMNTKLYGTYTLGTNKEKSIIFRHVITPSMSFSFAPDFGESQYGFWKTVQTNASGATKEYSPYQGSIYGTGSSSATAAITFGLENNLEAKIPSDKDTSGFRKITIIEGLSIRSSYNFLADSLRLSPFSVSLRVPVVTGYTLNLNATLDPYALNSDGRKIDRFMVQDGGLVRLTSLSFSAGYGFKSKASKKSKSGQSAINNPENNNNGNNYVEQKQGDFFAEQAALEGDLSQMDRAFIAAGEYYDFNIPWSLNLNYSFNYTNTTGEPRVMQTINASGSVNLTDKWGISMSAGYDFEMGEITPGTVQITRDLHCWQMSFSWVPVGFRQSWSFTIQAKSSMLSDLLKWDKNNSFLDNYYN